VQTRKKHGALGILPNISFKIKLSTDGIRKSRLVYITENRMGFLTTSPLRSRPYWLGDVPVRLHNLNNNKKIGQRDSVQRKEQQIKFRRSGRP